MNAAVHLVAKPRPGFRQVVEPASARWLWTHLRAAFPHAFALCLMPDHLHLLVPGGADQDLLRRVLAHHGRVFGTTWSIHAERSSTEAIVWRTIRYIFLNPVRAGYVDDPWWWPWSTLRDLGGLIADPWTIDAVRSIARVPRGQVLPSLTRLQDGRAPSIPAAAELEALPVTTLPSIACAAASALRLTPGDIRHRGAARDLFVHTALACNPNELERLADACDVSTRAIQRLRNKETVPGLRSALRCLQDPRLLAHDVDRRWLLRPYRNDRRNLA